MRKELSTPLYWVYRWLIPGLLTFVAIGALWILVINREGPPDIESLILASLIAGTAVIVARLFDRAKRVWITDDALIFAAYGKEHTVRLSELTEVRETKLFRPHRICLIFKSPTAFGTQIVFFPPLKLKHWLSAHPTTRTLKENLQKAS